MCGSLILIKFMVMDKTDLRSNDIDKVARALKFLAEMQKLRKKPILRSRHYVENDGIILDWKTYENALNEAHKYVDWGQEAEGSLSFDEEMKVTLHQVEKPSAPESHIDEWVETTIHKGKQRYIYLEEIAEGESVKKFEDLSESHQQEILNFIEINNEYLHLEKYRDLLAYLSKINTKFRNGEGDFELVLGTARVSWVQEEENASKTIDRHLLHFKAGISYDIHTGSFEIVIENEMNSHFSVLPSEKNENFYQIKEIEALIKENSLNFTWNDFQQYSPALRNIFGNKAILLQYNNNQPTSSPTISWDPALILKKVDEADLSVVFEDLAQRIQDSEKIPVGFRSLIDANFKPDSYGSDDSTNPGAIIYDGTEIFSSLPLNTKQKEVLKRADSSSHTLVQGPPGTGKTHLAAALVSHLLAQGKRILVTAKAERALYELKDKLPEAVQDLAVSVIGTGREDNSQLRASIDTISRKKSEYKPEIYHESIQELETKIDSLLQWRNETIDRWVKSRQRIASNIESNGQIFQLDDVVHYLNSLKDNAAWIVDLETQSVNDSFILSLTEDQIDFALYWVEKERENSDVISELESIDDISNDELLSISPERVQQMVETLSQLREKYETLNEKIPSRVENWAEQLNETRLAILSETSQEIHNKIIEAQHFLPNESLSFLSVGAREWLLTNRSIFEIISTEVEDLKKIWPGIQGVRNIVAPTDFSKFEHSASILKEYLLNGGQVKIGAEGNPKIGLLSNKSLKIAQEFLTEVKFSNKSLTTVPEIDTFLSLVTIQNKINVIQDIWPFPKPQVSSHIVVSADQWIRLGEKYVQLYRLVELIIKTADEYFQGDVKPANEYADYHKHIADVLDLRELADKQLKVISDLKYFQNNLGVDSDLSNALHKPEILTEYRNKWLERKSLLHDMNNLPDWKSMRNNLEAWAPGIVQMLIADDKDNLWRSRLESISDAVSYRNVYSEVQYRRELDVDGLLATIKKIDQRITSAIAKLAGSRAWSHALNDSRINQEIRGYLEGYLQQIHRLGKGTGKRAPEIRKNIKYYLEKSRIAVPVWIMPIDKLVQQFTVAENMFDVVIVDEASQAGFDAIFLQYLAPQIIVIGDDKQVSPQRVGIADAQIDALVKRFLFDSHLRMDWSDPKRSLFDEAKMRYGSRIILDEHRRSFSEIINFSNKYIYSPENIILHPVRQADSHRLPPFKITHTPSGYYHNEIHKINKVEADILVERLSQLIQDPAYNDKTVGIISLLASSRQAQYITDKMLELIPASEIEKRNIKVGKAEDFQGAERDVILLSLVEPNTSKGRHSALTGIPYQQSFNVAVSRAKEQVWLFHSVSKHELNPDCMRFKLLDYAYAVASSDVNAVGILDVSDETRQQPFDSLFEQRVYNRLVRLGYTVEPQVSCMGYSIDLVVRGENGSVAIECDGERWHGSDRYEQDLFRQSQLEKAGWRFIRIWDYDFNSDPEETIRRVEGQLYDNGVSPFNVSEIARSANIEVVENPTFIPDDNSIGVNLATEHPQGNFLEASNTTNLSQDIPNGYHEITDDSLMDELPSKLESNDAMVDIINMGEFNNNVKFTQAETNDVLVRNQVSLAGKSKTEVVSFFDDQYFIAAQAWLRLAPYVEPSSVIKPFDSQSLREQRANLQEVVSSSGPIVSKVLFQNIISRAGQQKVSHTRSAILSSSLNRLVELGKVQRMSPPQELTMYDDIYYTSSEQLYTPRDSGRRKLEEITFIELSMTMLRAMEEHGEYNRDRVFRRVLAYYGLKRLTGNVQAFLTPMYNFLLRIKVSNNQ